MFPIHSFFFWKSSLSLKEEPLSLRIRTRNIVAGGSFPLALLLCGPQGATAGADAYKIRPGIQVARFWPTHT